MKVIFLSVIFALLCGLISIMDADFFLYLLPSPTKDAFQDNVVWITGASSGIGAAIAIDLCKVGATVVLSARREDRLAAIVESCNQIAKEHKSAGLAIALPLDVLDLNAQESAVKYVLQKFGKIDSVVLNAGRTQRNIAIETDLQDTEEIMRLNFFSYVSLAKLVLPSMIAKKSGQVVVMSSVSGIIPTPIGSSYSASKFALHGYFNALRSEIEMHNVSVTIVCPGPVESEIADHAFRNPSYPQQAEGHKMKTSRCSELVVRGMHHRLPELWITPQPILLLTHLAQLCPPLARVLGQVAAKARMYALKEGQDIFDMQKTFGLKK